MPYQPRSRDEMVFSEFSITNQGTPYPLTEGMLHRFFAKYASSLWASSGQQTSEGYDWEDFMANCLVDITEFQNNTGFSKNKHPPRRFATVAEFISFINSKIPNNGSTFLSDSKIRIYSIIDGSVPSVNKIYAFNHFYHSLNQGSAFNKESRLQTGGSFPNNKDFVVEAWKAVWGIDIPITGADGYDLNSNAWDGTVWFQTRKGKNLYSLPPVGVGVGVTCGGGPSSNRHARDEASGNLVQMNDAAYIDASFEFLNSIVASIPQSSGYSTFNEVSDPQEKIQAPDPVSHVIIYGVMYGNKKALYVKPFGGIDEFCVPKYDTTKYQLEACYSAPQHKDRFKIITVNNGQGHDTYTERIFKSELFRGGRSRSIMRKVINKDSAWDVRFYLRWIGTDYVSPFGAAYISANHKNNGYSPLDFLVNRDTP